MGGVGEPDDIIAGSGYRMPVLVIPPSVDYPVRCTSCGCRFNAYFARWRWCPFCIKIGIPWTMKTESVKTEAISTPPVIEPSRIASGPLPY